MFFDKRRREENDIQKRLQEELEETVRQRDKYKVELDALKAGGGVILKRKK